MLYFFFFLPARSAALPAAAVKKKNPTCPFGDGGKENKILIDATIRIVREILCLPYAGFFG